MLHKTSQNNEQEYILKYYKNFKGKFLDVGAHNGVDFSNSFFLIELGWQGICVEPNPLFRSFETLIKTRKCICENVAISSSNGEVDFVARGTNAQLSGIYDKNYSQKDRSTHK